MKHFFFGKARSAHIQFFRYLFVGGSSAVLDLTIYTVATEYFGVHYLLANILAFIGGLSWNYILSLGWIFESKHARTREVMMVLLIALLGLLWTELLLYAFVEWMDVHHFVAKVIATWIVLFWNFGMRKLYVFH